MIFRIHSNGPVDLKSWSSRGNKLSDDAIKDINDDLVEGNAAKVATSIPNPFARMYLFETAFQMIKDDNHFGNSLYHQLVSDCLDVFQLLFMMGDNNQNIQFKKWSVNNRINELKAKGNISVSGKQQPHGHKLLGMSMELFTRSKRFRDFTDIYLIYYRDILLGGTSPITVFFTSPNFQRQMEENGIAFPPSHSTDILFDREPASLHERDEEFQQYMHKFRAAFKADLSNRCPELNQYLINSAANNNPGILTNISDTYNVNNLVEEYKKINVDPQTAETLNAGIFPVMKFPQEKIQIHISKNSGFVIQNTVEHFRNYTAEDGTEVELYTPLALVSDCNASVTYINKTWEPNTRVEYIANKELHKRVLPKSDNTIYPYVTTEDFLEENLIEMPYAINNNFFFSGFSGKFEYLLPIKKEYFNFFTLEDLKEQLQISNDPEKVTVSLRVPVRDGNRVEFKKIYDKRKHVYKLPDPTMGFGIGIFPFYQIQDADYQHLNDYLVMLVDNAEKDIDLRFYKFNKIIHKETQNYSKKVRQPKSADMAGSIYYRLENNTNNAFDIIEVVNDIYQGLIIPKFKKLNVKTHTQKFNFAIDFGTSNTHIAYNSASDPAIKPFNIDLDDIQMVMLNSRGKDTSGAQNLGESFNYGFGQFYQMIAIKNREFVPSIIGENANIKYPVRTSTCESKSFIAETPEIFGNINIGYYLDAEEKILDHTRYATNIKWGMETNPGGIPEQNRVSIFFEQILWMIKNKILLNNGTLDPNISWFVPISMKMPIRNIFGNLWKEAKNKVFGEDTTLKMIQESESTVPYFYLKNKHGFYRANDALNIDIGGGTVDIIFLANTIGKSFSTSCKYGANDIWGDGITHTHGVSQKDNGFFLMMKQKIDKEELKLDGKIKNYYQTFYKNSTFNSADMVSFLFKYDKFFNFSNSIQAHSNLPTLLFLHYSSLIYHISQIIKEKDINIPMYLTFTGKGSEYIKIIFPDAQVIEENRKSEIDKFTGILLEKFTGKKLEGIFKVYLEDSPKEVTANGGISMMTDEEIDIDPQDIIQKGFTKDHAPEGYDNDSQKLKNKDLENIQEAVMQSIYEFIDVLSKDEELNEFFNRYDVSFQFGDENLKQKVERFAPHSFNQIKTDLNKHGMPDDLIEESPFFWGLKDVFYRLSKELYKSDN